MPSFPTAHITAWIAVGTYGAVNHLCYSWGNYRYSMCGIRYHRERALWKQVSWRPLLNQSRALNARITCKGCIRSLTGTNTNTYAKEES